MTLALPLRLTREAPAECAGWYVPGDCNAALAALAALSLEPAPRVHAVRGGWVLLPDVPHDLRAPGTLRLRQLAPGLYAPIDAAFEPGLLDDEARGFAGLMLPGEYLDLSRPVRLAQLVARPKLRTREWQPLPQPEARATEIHELILDRPEDNTEDVLKQGNEDIAEQEPAPDESGAGKSAMGKAEFTAGRAIAGLGRALGWKGLENAGGKLIGKGMDDSPGITQGLLGKQEAALRDLLRRFREGRTEEALRRAMPLSGEPGRGSRAAGNANLPFNNLVYSLGNVLGAARGAAASWFTEPDVYAALVAEYRKAAEQARADGDFRRAALIHGKLLGDWRSAAALLTQGGRHHDAAVLYLQKLDDKAAAARSYELAGEIDQAVKLYRTIGRHVDAGDLLRRHGEEDSALDEYRSAARDMAERARHLAAGELLMGKGLPAAEALVYFERGWQSRPGADAVPCAVHLAVISADAGDASTLQVLTDEADRYFGPAGREHDAATYYNMLATLSRREALAEHAPRLRDRALMGLAHKLRQRPGKELLFESGAWSNALVSDAQYALKHRPREKLAGPRTSGVVSTVTIARGEVTAACMAAGTGELFVGYRDGRVVSFSALRGVQGVRDEGAAIAGLSCDSGARQLYVLQDDGAGRILSVFGRTGDGRFARGSGNLMLPAYAALLGAGIVHRGLCCALVADGVLSILEGEQLLPLREHPGDESAPLYHTAVFLSKPDGRTDALLAAYRTLHLWSEGGAMREEPMHWEPEGLIAGATVSVLRTAARALEITGRTHHGSLYHSTVEVAPGEARCESRLINARGDFLCATLTGQGQVAAVTPGHVAWFRRQGDKFSLGAVTNGNFQQAVAAYHQQESGELIVLTGDGRALLVAMP